MRDVTGSNNEGKCSAVDEETRYAWIVDATWRQDGYDPGRLVRDTEYSRDGMMGPRDAPADLLARLQRGEGRQWRTLVDVDYPGHPEELRVVHTGRYLSDAYDPCDPPDIPEDAAFGPLDDLSRPDAGAVDIQYRNTSEGRWFTL